jgi:hypothetical protein
MSFERRGLDKKACSWKRAFYERLDSLELDRVQVYRRGCDPIISQHRRQGEFSLV